MATSEHPSEPCPELEVPGHAPIAPHYTDGRVTLWLGDCLDVLRQLDDASVDAVCTDPPYGLEFMGKEWDSPWKQGADVHAEARTRRADEMGDESKRRYIASAVNKFAAGLPFQQWCELWATECLRVLKPGGHLLAFGGTRTWHRLACAVEDAGFEVRDSIAWLYGCLSDDTEILTDEGWVRYDRATTDHRALSFDTETGSLGWQQIQHVHRYWHDGEMVRLHSDETDQLLTPNHRVVLDAQSRVPYAADVRCLLDRVLEAERLGEADDGTLLLETVQRGQTRGRVGDARLQGSGCVDGRQPRELPREDDGSEQPRMEGRRYRVQEARELCRSAVRESAGVGASDGAQGRLHHGASATDGGPLWLSDDPARGREPREPRPEGQQAGEPHTLAEQSRSQAVRVGQDGGRGILPSTHVAAEWVGYAGVVWCITVPSGAFIARRNGLIFATGNSGFPKSLDVSKAIDKAAGAEREVVGRVAGAANGSVVGLGSARSMASEYDATTPATDDARKWAGFGTALKPAHEPIVVARKPLTSTVAGNVLAYGTGALNIDGCRVGTEDTRSTADRKPAQKWAGGVMPMNSPTGSAAGRWPANVVLDDTQTAALDAMSGDRPAGGKVTGRQTSRTGESGIYGEYGAVENSPYDDNGGASRFFYTAKAPGSERVKLNGTAHPTVKPLDLMRWLVRLVTPPNGLVLEPFAGSGTTVEACLLEGFRCVAIEREPDYLPLIMQRIHRRIDPVAAIKATQHDGGLFDLLDEDTA
jgi:DNA modification methylase